MTLAEKAVFLFLLHSFAAPSQNSPHAQICSKIVVILNEVKLPKQGCVQSSFSQSAMRTDLVRFSLKAHMHSQVGKPHV